MRTKEEILAQIKYCEQRQADALDKGNLDEVRRQAAHIYALKYAAKSNEGYMF